MDWSLQIVHWMCDLVIFWVLLMCGIRLFDWILVYIIAPWIKKI